MVGHPVSASSEVGGGGVAVGKAGKQSQGQSLT